MKNPLSFQPVASLLANREVILRYSGLANVLQTFVIGVLLVAYLEAQKGSVRFFTPTGTPGGSSPPSEAVSVHRLCLLGSTLGLFARVPATKDSNGLLYPELLQEFFTPKAQMKALRYVDQEVQKFRDELITQTVHPRHITATNTTDSQVLAMVSGDLARHGQIQGKTYQQVIPFKIHVDLRVNEDLFSNNRKPYLVHDFLVELGAR